MTTYSYSQLEGLWIQAGGSKVLAPLMAAIALAESQGNPGAVNPADNGGTQTSWGLWQISNGTHNWPGGSNPLNAMNNARYAVAKYRSQGLGAWGTYVSGAYQKYMQGNVPPSAVKGGGNATLTGFNPGGFVGGAASTFLKDMISGLHLPSLADGAKRLGLIVLGGLLLIVGIMMLAGRHISSTVTVVAPESAAAGAVSKGRKIARG